KSSATSNSLVSEFAHYLNMTALSSIRGNLNPCGRAFEQTALMGRAIRSDARICRLALSSEAVVISGAGEQFQSCFHDQNAIAPYSIEIKSSTTCGHSQVHRGPPCAPNQGATHDHISLP